MAARRPIAAIIKRIEYPKHQAPLRKVMNSQSYKDLVPSPYNQQNYSRAWISATAVLLTSFVGLGAGAVIQKRAIPSSPSQPKAAPEAPKKIPVPQQNANTMKYWPSQPI